MTKERKSPTILKPEIDEETALRFASADSGSAMESPREKLPKAVERKPKLQKDLPEEVEKGMRQISLTIKKSLYEKIAKDAARKNRTVEEHLRKHLAKRYNK